MKNSIFRGAWMIIATFILAFILDFLPLGYKAIWFRPSFTLLVLFYWVLNVPQRVNVGVAFTIGILFDLLSGTLLGEHALVFVLLTYLLVRLQHRFHIDTLLQQSILIALLLLGNKAMIFIIQLILGQWLNSGWYWLSLLTSLLIWPLLAIILDSICSRRNIA